MPEVKAAETLASFLQSLSTVGLVIVSITIIIFALSKFGVFNKLLDKGISKINSSTNDIQQFNELVSKVNELLTYNEEAKLRLDSFENQTSEHINYDHKVMDILEKLENRLSNLEKSFGDYRQEAYKRMVFNGQDLLIDRMAVGIKYLLDGGNGDTRKYLLDNLAFQDLVTWNGLCKALDANQFWVHENRKENKDPNPHRRKSDSQEWGGNYEQSAREIGHHFGIQL